MYFINFYNGKQKRQRWGQSSRGKDAPTSNSSCIYCGKVFAQREVDGALKIGDLSRKLKDVHLHWGCGVKKLKKAGIENTPSSRDDFVKLLRNIYLKDEKKKQDRAYVKFLRLYNSITKNSTT